MTMLTDTRMEHEAGGWRMDFRGDDGDAVSIRVAAAPNSVQRTAH